MEGRSDDRASSRLLSSLLSPFSLAGTAIFDQKARLQVEKKENSSWAWSNKDPLCNIAYVLLGNGEYMRVKWGSRREFSAPTIPPPRPTIGLQVGC